MREKSLSLCQHHCREVSTMHGGELFWSDHAENKGQPLTLWVLLLTAQFPWCFALLRPKAGLLALWFLVSRSHETKKPITS